jgi:hypothetical protein
LTCLPYFRPSLYVHQQPGEDDGSPLLQLDKHWLDMTNPLKESMDALPEEVRLKGVVYVANHQSWADIYSLAWCGFPMKFVSKEQIL